METLSATSHAGPGDALTFAGQRNGQKINRGTQSASKWWTGTRPHRSVGKHKAKPREVPPPPPKAQVAPCGAGAGPHPQGRGITPPEASRGPAKQEIPFRAAHVCSLVTPQPGPCSRARQQTGVR